MFSIRLTFNPIIQKFLHLQKHLHFLLGNILKKEDEKLSTERISFSASNNAIHAFFLNQNVNLPISLYNELLVFLL